MTLTPDAVKHRPVTDLTKIDLDALQGNILKGHGREHTSHLFIRFGADPAKTRGWLKSLLTNPPGPGDITVTNHNRQMLQAATHSAGAGSGELFCNLLVTAAGYTALGKTPPGDPKFRDGMKASAGALQDPPPNTWESGFQGEIHAMLLLAHDDPRALTRFELAASAAITGVAGATIVQVEHGDALRNGQGNSIEHFGYVDGRSQPLFLKEDVESERDQTDGISVWDPAEDAFKLVLVRDPLGAGPKVLGSYFVFRKLEQNVKGFKELEEKLGEKLGLEDHEVAGAMVVGRFEDGTPVVLQNEEGSTHPVPNNFNYDGDPAGIRCPLQSHIRKMNPRGDLPRRGGPFAAGEEVAERVHRIARRGIPYGLRKPDLSDRPTKDVGLLFMCFQQDLTRQFEFLQSAWANNEDFPEPLGGGAGPKTGVDPVIGQGGTTPQNWPTEWGGTTTQPFLFEGFVRLRGGEYFFAPSLPGIAAL